MSNTSATGGILQPTNTSFPLNGVALDDFFYDYFTALLNFGDNRVIPKFQQQPGDMPDINTDWISHGIIDERDDTFSSETYIEGIGSVINYNQELDVLISVYGPNRNQTSMLLRAGMYLAQNREMLKIQGGLVLVKINAPRNVSLVINQQIQGKVDFVITFRRVLSIIYPVDYLLSGEAGLYCDAEPNEIIENIVVDNT